MHCNLAFSEFSWKANISLLMRKNRFFYHQLHFQQQYANYPAASSIPTAVFQISERKKETNFGKAFAAQKLLLNWNWKMSSVLLCKVGGMRKLKILLYRAREFLFAKHRHSQDNPLHNLWIIYIFRWGYINISVKCLAVWEWTQTFLGSYHITVLSLRLCDIGRIHGEKGDIICNQCRYIDRNPGTNETVMSVAILAQLNLLIV